MAATWDSYVERQGSLYQTIIIIIREMCQKCYVLLWYDIMSNFSTVIKIYTVVF
jgi:hypothetical protein